MSDHDPHVRLGCFHCEEMIAVPLRKLRNQDHAHDYLRAHDWIFGIVTLPNGAIVFDPLCPVHGRETVARWLESGAEISPSARVRLEQIFPDLFVRPQGGA